MNDKGTLAIETPRLLLRQFCVEDAPAMYRNWASDSEVTKYLTWQPHKSPEATAEVVNIWVNKYADTDYYNWAIVPKSLGEPIGGISVVERNDETECVCIGYCIGREWWGRGITAEALGALMTFFFGTVGVKRIEATHDVRNPNSGKVMRKCGMRQEGVLRQAKKNNLGVCDVAVYSVLREEYFAARR